MLRPTMTRCLAALALGALAGCVVDEEVPAVPRLPALAPLAQDPEQPMLALFEHVLTGYFAGAGSKGPTTCAVLHPGALTAEQEQALILRFVRLAPAARCRVDGSRRVDALTGAPAAAVEVYDFECASEALCRGWATVPGRPATRYALRFEQGEWRFDGDRRIVAE